MTELEAKAIQKSRQDVIKEVKELREKGVPVITGSSSALYFEQLPEGVSQAIGCEIMRWETKLVSWSKEKGTGAGYLTLCHFKHPILGPLSGVGDPDKLTGEVVAATPTKGKDSPKEGLSYVRWELS